MFLLTYWYWLYIHCSRMTGMVLMPYIQIQIICTRHQTLNLNLLTNRKAWPECLQEFGFCHCSIWPFQLQDCRRKPVHRTSGLERLVWLWHTNLDLLGSFKGSARGIRFAERCTELLPIHAWKGIICDAHALYAPVIHCESKFLQEKLQNVVAGQNPKELKCKMKNAFVRTNDGSTIGQLEEVTRTRYQSYTIKKSRNQKTSMISIPFNSALYMPDAARL